MALVVGEETFSYEVLESSIPVLVNFWAPWCSLCHLVHPILMGLQSEEGEQFKLVSINADKNLKLANRYRLTNLPTILLLDRGKVCYRFDEIRCRDDLRVASDEIRLTLSRLTMSYSCSA